MDKIKVKELLSGYTMDIQGIQSMANMVVIPLVSEKEYTPIADFTSIHLNQDCDYGSLQFKNEADDIGILLQGYTIISDQSAQDRTVPYPRLIKGNRLAIVGANCIQPNQCGHFNAQAIKSDDFKILPPSLRAKALIHNPENSEHTKFSALWDTLSTWTKAENCRDNGLVSFYAKFKNQLDEFIASFEPVKNQLGTITLLNGQVIAIDIVPKYTAWLQIFRPLIRDSYGAEACRLIQNKQIKSLVSLLDDDVDTVKDLNKAFTKNTEHFFDRIKDIVKENVELETEYKTLQDMNDLHLVKFEAQNLIGCGIFHGDHIVYLSLVSKKITYKKEKIDDFEKTGIYSNNRFTI